MNLVTQIKQKTDIELVENLYLVDKHGYDKCNATNGVNVLECKNPNSNQIESTVQVFQPNHGNDGLEYHPGKEYYFIGELLYRHIRIYILLLCNYDLFEIIHLVLRN
mgnify:CR=1 FL=1